MFVPLVAGRWMPATRKDAGGVACALGVGAGQAARRWLARRGVDQDRGVDVAAAQREVIDAEYPRHGHLRQRKMQQ